MATSTPQILTESTSRFAPQMVAQEAPRKRTSSIVGWVGIGLVVVFALELTCRVEDWVTYRMPIWSPYTELNDLVMRDADGMHGRPNAQYEKWVMNSIGTRGPQASVLPAPGTLRIITVGASETFGLRESPGREYPRQLEDTLNARLRRGACVAPAPKRFEVLNAAFAGMAMPTIDQDVRNRLRRFRPAMVVIYPTPAQYLEDETPFPAKPDSSGRAVTPSLLDRLRPRFAFRLREQIKQILPMFIQTRLRAIQTRLVLRAHAPGWRFDGIPSDRLARYNADLRHLIGSIRKIGAIPVLVTHGNIFRGHGKPDPDMQTSWEKFYPRATGSAIIALDSVARDVTLEIGADSGVVTVDAAQRLAAAPVSIFADFVHFTDAGASIMADTVSGGILHAAQQVGMCGRPATDAPPIAGKR